MQTSGIGLFNLTLSKKAIVLWAIAVLSFGSFVLTTLSWGGSALPFLILAYFGILFGPSILHHFST